MSKTDILRIPDYLEHIIEAIERIYRYIDDMSEIEFLADRDLFHGRGITATGPWYGSRPLKACGSHLQYMTGARASRRCFGCFYHLLPKRRPGWLLSALGEGTNSHRLYIPEAARGLFQTVSFRKSPARIE